MEINTNHDFYRAISDLIEDPNLSSRLLEEYLRALLYLVYEGYALPNLTAVGFFNILSDAGSVAALPFEESWRINNTDDENSLQGFRGLEATLIRQVVDLRELSETGKLNDKYKYFGIDSPRGHLWYNFDPGTFLECATEGFFKGWAPEKGSNGGTGSKSVKVVTMDGTLDDRDPSEFARPIYPIEQVNWDDFRKFLLFGQMYE